MVEVNNNNNNNNNDYDKQYEFVTWCFLFFALHLIILIHLQISWGKKYFVFSCPSLLKKNLPLPATSGEKK